MIFLRFCAIAHNRLYTTEVITACSIAAVPAANSRFHGTPSAFIRLSCGAPAYPSYLLFHRGVRLIRRASGQARELEEAFDAGPLPQAKNSAPNKTSALRFIICSFSQCAKNCTLMPFIKTPVCTTSFIFSCLFVFLLNQQYPQR